MSTEPELQSLCDLAGHKAGGSVMNWAQARAAELARARRRRLGGIALALGAGLLALGVFAAQFRDEPVPAASTVAVSPALPAVTTVAPASAVAPAAVAPVVSKGAAEGTTFPLFAKPSEATPAEPAASAPENSESQPDGSC